MGEYIIKVGFLIYAVGWLALIRQAFKEKTSLGFWVLAVPVVGLHFLFTRMDKTSASAVTILAGLVLMVAGFFFIQPGS